MHHVGCKKQLFRWTSATLEPSTEEEEEEETIEEEEDNIRTTNPPTASKVMPLTWGTLQMHVFNADKWDIMPENAPRDNNAQGTTGKIKQPT